MLRAENLSRSFDGKQVLRAFSATFEDGGRYALMGPSGCGKTTLLRMLMGLLAPDSGRIIREGAVRMSALFQEDRLLEHLSALQNLTLIPSVTARAAEDMLLKTGLDAESIRKPAELLSGGMKRRTALARALLAGHDILFLDEPYKGLDPQTRETVRRIVSEHETGRTVIMVTHDESDAEGYTVIRL